MRIYFYVFSGDFTYNGLINDHWYCHCHCILTGWVSHWNWHPLRATEAAVDINTAQSWNNRPSKGPPSMRLPLQAAPWGYRMNGRCIHSLNYANISNNSYETAWVVYTENRLSCDLCTLDDGTCLPMIFSIEFNACISNYIHSNYIHSNYIHNGM